MLCDPQASTPVGIGHFLRLRHGFQSDVPILIIIVAPSAAPLVATDHRPTPIGRCDRKRHAGSPGGPEAPRGAAGPRTSSSRGLTSWTKGGLASPVLRQCVVRKELPEVPTGRLHATDLAIHACGGAEHGGRGAGRGLGLGAGGGGRVRCVWRVRAGSVISLPFVSFLTLTLPSAIGPSSSFYPLLCSLPILWAPNEVEGGARGAGTRGYGARGTRGCKGAQGRGRKDPGNHQ